MPALLQTRRAVLPGTLTGLLRTRLPQPAAIVERWSADDIPAQIDNTNLVSWTGSVGGIAVTQATGAAQPKYRTGGAGGKPYVLFGGAHYMNAGNSTNAVSVLLRDAAQGNTSLIVFRNQQATTYGFLFSGSVSTGYNLYANGSQAGMFGLPDQRMPYAGTGLSTICYTKLLPDSSSGRVYINNSCINHSGAATTAAGQDVWIGGTTTGGTPVKAEIYDVIVWNRALSGGEVMQAEKWARDKYAAPYPWAGSPFRVFHGDSITNGLGASAALNTYPAKVAAANGWSLGQWTNLGHTGACYTGSPSGFNLVTEALTDVDPMVGLLGATPIHLATFEWYNQRTASTPEARATTYLQARRNAGIAKIVFGTGPTYATDTAGSPDAARAAYDAYWDNAVNRAGLMDAYVPIHSNANIGAAGACPAASPYTPYFYTDGIHLADTGYLALAGLIGPAIAAL